MAYGLAVLASFLLFKVLPNLVRQIFILEQLPIRTSLLLLLIPVLLVGFFLILQTVSTLFESEHLWVLKFKHLQFQLLSFGHPEEIEVVRDDQEEADNGEDYCEEEHDGVLESVVLAVEVKVINIDGKQCSHVWRLVHEDLELDGIQIC